jgi:hypothetical protein
MEAELATWEYEAKDGPSGASSRKWFDEFRTSSQRTEEGHGPKHAQSPG